jgi:hypothetical protein
MHQGFVPQFLIGQHLMPKRLPALSTLAFIIPSIVFLGACGSGGKGGAATVTAVTITPDAASVQVNNIAEFTANVTLSNTTSTTSTVVTWSVNGAVGGSSTVGTIVPSPTDAQVGVYTAPAAVPTTNDGQVNITAAAPVDPSSTTSTALVTSNTAIVTITIGQGLQVTPAATTVSASGHFTFSATLNGVADPNVTWSIVAANGANVGEIGPSTGLFTAPPSPPPGGTVGIFATDGTATASATARIIYADASLSGPYAFAFSGNDVTGYSATAGSFVSDGQGHISSGVEDIDAFSTGVSTEVPITGTYVVNADGTGTAVINKGAQTAATWQFTLTTNQHAEIVRFDPNNTASGTMDQQNLTDLSNSLSVISGPYVFLASGADPGFKPFGAGGKFSADGFGTISDLNSILDVNDNGTLVAEDRSLAGTYSFDSSFPGTGRGVLALTSTTAGQFQYAFYIVDETHLRIVEIDQNAFAAGDVFSALAGDSFSTASLTSGSYVFSVGGTSPSGAFTLVGAFTSGANGSLTNGTAESNNGGSVQLDVTMSACAYTVDQSTGRIALALNFGGGGCTVGAKGTASFAAYQTAKNSAIMLGLDSNPVASGTFFTQSSTSSLSGNYALGLAGQGILHNSPGAIQQNAAGQLTLSGSAVTAGNLDINNFNAVFGGDPISSTTSSLVAPASGGRGTMILTATNPSVQYNLVYYVVDGNTAVLFDKDSNLILIGTVALQF